MKKTTFFKMMLVVMITSSINVWGQNTSNFNDGYLCVFKNAAPAGSSVVLTGTTTSGSATITNISSTASLALGMSVTGTGVPNNAAITAIIDGTSITINANLTASGTPSLTFNAAQGSWGTAVVVEEYLPNTASQSSPNFSIALPTTGSNKIICGATTSSNGAMTRSENGRYLIVPGYFNNLGDLNSLYTLPVMRTLNGTGTLGVGIQAATTGWYTAANDYRGAVSDDGTNFWTSGGTLGVRYSNDGITVTTVTTGTGSSYTNIRVVNIFNGQLFYSTGSGTPSVGIYQVGTGKPTSVIASTPTILTAPTSYSFSISPDGLTMYAINTNTIVKYIYSGGAWGSAITCFTLTAATGLAVDWTNYSFSTTGLNNAIIYACNTTNLVAGNDNGTAAITTTTLKALTGLNSFKQLAFSPIKQTVSLGTGSPAVSNLAQGVSNAVLFQFNLKADEGNSTIKKLTLAETGTEVPGTDVSNFRLIYDANGDGIADPSEIAVPLATGTVSGTSIVFSNISQTYINQGSSNNYLVIGDISATATTGNTIIPSIVSNKTLNSVNYTTNLVNAGASYVNIGTIAPTGNTLSIVSSGGGNGLSNPTSHIAVTVSKGIINFNAIANQTVEIFNAVGQKLISKTTVNGLNTIAVSAKGVVLVKVGSQISKVVL